MFAKSKNPYVDALPGDVFEGQPERLTVGRGDDDAGQALGTAQRDVFEHVAVDVAVFVDLGLGEDGESDVPQRLDPGPHDVGASRCDVGEDGGLGLKRDRRLVVGATTCEFGGTGEQPPAERVEAGAVRGGGPATEDRAETHVEIRRVPHQQHALGGGDLFGLFGDVVQLGNLLGDAHGRIPSAAGVDFVHRNSVMALPARCAFASKLVVGRSTEIGTSSSAPMRRSSGSASPTSAICSAYPAWSVAACRTPPRWSRSAINATVAGCSRRRLWWRALGHGSGKYTRTPVSWSEVSRCSRTSTPSPRISRTFVSPSRSTALSSWPRP